MSRSVSVNIFNLKKFFMTTILLAVLIFTGCASKYEHYQNDITDSLEPAALLELAVNIISDDSLELQSKQELISLLSERAIILVDIYINSVNDGNIYTNNNLVLMTDFFRVVLNNREMIDDLTYEQFKIILLDLIRSSVVR